MCIRDSYRHDYREASVKNNMDIEILERKRRGRETHLEHMPCLLYTSDAADERSSVDLGGRRIIKKKNTESSAGRPMRI